MEWLGSILVATLIVLLILAICASWENRPTWTGVIISAMMGCLPFYLILCFFGIMGEEDEEKDDEREKPKPKKKPKPKPKKRDEFDYENADDYGPEYDNADKYGAEYEVER